MENQKLLSLLNDVNDSKFPKRKLQIFNDNSKANYDAVMKWSFKSNLCDYNEAYILVKSIITVRPASQTQI